MNRRTLLLSLSSLMLLMAGRVVAQTPVPQTPVQQDPSKLEAVITTEAGEFRMGFAPDKAPKHVEQFIRLARQGYYDGSAFHRVVLNGMIQGGDPLLKNPKTPKAQWGSGGLNMLPSEFSDMKHLRGTVSTASIPGKPNSDGAQFFVLLAPQPTLDGNYTAFATVSEGIEVVQKISEAQAGENGIVDKPVKILKVTIENKKEAPYLHSTKDEMRKTVALNTTLGTVRVKMEPDWAPETVRNFLGLVASGWYNGTAFHRIAKGFVVQGGTAGTRGPNPADRWVHNIKGEFNKDIKHERGTISMARADDPDSADTSFFLVLAPAPHLDGTYAAFGHMVDGEDVLKAFEKEEVDGETPKRALVLIDAKVED